ncbi:MAG: undecaprenyldiphospho-muramoylpentapeptide beta-N-acetylglucosaminyltransferase [Eubacteriales bacterium]|nr:undecaprenyldiphospho-muramoylpentapeptide beta-N-acetylglucosaminyltransferase [Eubacteriales bacterium]
MSKTVVLTGGGTAGHVTPNLAIIPKLKEMGLNIEYIGTKNGMEREIMSGTDIPYHIICAGKFRRYFSIRNLTDPVKIIAGLTKAKRILKRIKPAAVFSKGGFVSVPVVLAAHSLNIPVILHESDYTPGLANRICIPRADKVCVAFLPTLQYIPDGKGVYTGLPIRSELLKGDRQKGLEICGFSGEKPVLLIMGGSLGAKALNDTLDGVMAELVLKYDVAHIRGKKNLRCGTLPDGYRQFGYVGEGLADIYAASDIMLSRAGATAVFEILALAMPALLVPLPKSSSRGDQLLNAEYFKQKGYSHVLYQEQMTKKSLVDGIDTLYQQKNALNDKMKSESATDAADKVARIIADA